jgi:hypothetical protein
MAAEGLNNIKQRKTFMMKQIRFRSIYFSFPSYFTWKDVLIDFCEHREILITKIPGDTSVYLILFNYLQRLKNFSSWRSRP